MSIELSKKVKNYNNVIVEGRIYDFNLEVRTVQNQDSPNYGTNFIGASEAKRAAKDYTASISVALDDAATQIVKVEYPFGIRPVFGSGKPNSSYSAALSIIEQNKTILNGAGMDAMKVRLTPSIGINDFMGRDGQMVAAKRFEGGFINIISDLHENIFDRHNFKGVMLANGVIRQDADPEAHRDKDRLIVKGCMFDYRGAILPVEFYVYDETGFDYLESLDANVNSPKLLDIVGKMDTITTKEEQVTEYAFGAPTVTVRERTSKEWLITSAKEMEGFGEIYGEDALFTEKDITEAVQARNIYLAEKKRDTEQSRAAKAAPASTNSAFTVPAGGFSMNI